MLDRLVAACPSGTSDCIYVLALEQCVFGIGSADQIHSLAIVVNVDIDFGRQRSAVPIGSPDASIFLPLPAITRIDADLMIKASIVKRRVCGNSRPVQKRLPVWIRVIQRAKGSRLIGHWAVTRTDVWIGIQDLLEIRPELSRNHPLGTGNIRISGEHLSGDSREDSQRLDIGFAGKTRENAPWEAKDLPNLLPFEHQCLVEFTTIRRAR